MNITAKICGLSTPDTVSTAVSHNAAFLGFVFYEKSPRYVTPAQMARLSKDVPEHIKRVALCVDADDQQLKKIVDTAAPDFLQLHGRETPERAIQIRDLIDLPLIKAVQISKVEHVERAHDYEAVANILLFDAKPSATDLEALPGGNALSFDWSLLSRETWDIPWVLSGGLTKDNVGSAIKMTGAQMVDVSSGVESVRGVKDPRLIEEFLETVGRL